jgi:hypothetical protein
VPVEQLASMSVRELKAALAAAGVDAAGCVEKAELVERLRGALQRPAGS